MKKYLLHVFLLCCAFALVACGSTNTESENDTVEKTEVSSGTPEVKEEVVKEEPATLTVNTGEVLTVEDYAEITVKENKFGQVINPPNPDSFYTYYENKEQGEIFLDTVISIKSLLTSQKSSDEFVSVKIVYDDKYEYTTFSTIEEQGGTDFTYTNITSIEPLKTGTLHFLASLPSEVESDGKPLKAIITINGEDYEQIIR